MIQKALLVVLVQMGLSLSTVNGTFDRYVTNFTWDGVGFYISVKRETVQQKLDAFHDSVTDECGKGPKLFIPEKCFFAGVQDDHHPVYIDFGIVTSRDFSDYPKGNPGPSLRVSGREVSVAIPFLAANSSGPPIYALAIAVFYENSRGDIPKPNFIYPYIPVDKIEFSDSGAVVRNGTEELGISFTRHDHPCEPPASIVTDELDYFLSEEFHFGLPEPDFSFCDRHTFPSDFCRKANDVKCAVRRYAPNICQKYKKKSVQPCMASVDIVNITSAFRNITLLDNDVVNILASGSYPDGPSETSLRSPCQV